MMKEQCRTDNNNKLAPGACKMRVNEQMWQSMSSDDMDRMAMILLSIASLCLGPCSDATECSPSLVDLTVAGLIPVVGVAAASLLVHSTSLIPMRVILTSRAI